ncbi:hypothetical protein LOAG_00558 [Loa loa]|uniref:Uncharacterized protein n=1 Tax=Loa loa TaxID=7209 RepID=A0A1S0UB00_LOALO|nr:hypothetical protein LOAG_00558 [Loa loa]EFO27921.1 hypothetical protein LOAG_00558 [Loa loa]
MNCYVHRFVQQFLPVLYEVTVDNVKWAKYFWEWMLICIGCQSCEYFRILNVAIWKGTALMSSDRFQSLIDKVKVIQFITVDVSMQMQLRVNNLITADNIKSKTARIVGRKHNRL